MKSYYETLKEHIMNHPPVFDDRDSILALLYEAYNEINRMDDNRIKEDFNELYCQMNGIPLQEMDEIVYPVCKLCRDRESRFRGGNQNWDSIVARINVK